MAYLDNNATTALDERVLAAMLPYLRGQHGNPSSSHQLGRQARAAIDQARQQVAGLVAAHSSQVVFTSGGTEANNLALKGVAQRLPPGLIACSAVEHSSVLAPLAALQNDGWRLAKLTVDSDGYLVDEVLQQVVSRKPALLAVMAANNETGIVYDTQPVARSAREVGAIVLVDAVQAAGKYPLNFTASGAHLMSLSAHKIHGPQGIGALVVDKAVDMMPLLHGGGHERGRRAGTENVAAIVGFGKAAELAADELEARRRHTGILRAHLESRLTAELPKAVIFGQRAERLPNTCFFAVPGLDGETLLMALDQLGIAVSSGSACTTGDVAPSPVLMAMGIEADLARAAVRVSLSKDTTRDDVDRFVDSLKAQVLALQRFGSLACA
ncbi:MAG: cysteine desulfurase [Gammaproteobacteria bacterium]|nr:cysteine desulfurase [Gammaproteobacteria bacterium]